MRLPNWFKIGWWVLLTALVSTFLFLRYPDLVAARASAADVIVFLVWMALLLMPLFSEVEFLGFKFKQEVEKLKQEVKSEMQLVRTELRNAIDVSATISPQFHLGPAPSPESLLPEIEKRVQAAVAKAVIEKGETKNKPPEAEVPPPPEDVMELFSIRYRLEQELRFLAFAKIGLPERPPGTPQLARMLAERGLISQEVAGAIREVNAITSAATHGATPTEAQVAFVRDVAPWVIKSLKVASSGDEGSLR